MAKKIKLPKELRGKYVTRAAFAKMQGEKQQLERDIYRMIYLGHKHIWDKYAKQYKVQRDFNDALREALKGDATLLKNQIGKPE